MIWYRLRKKSPSDRDYLWTNPDERLYFKKEGLSIHVGTFYQTVEAAEKAREQIYRGEDKYDIVAFEMREVVDG